MKQRALPVLPLPRRADAVGALRSLTIACVLPGLDLGGSTTGQGAAGRRRVRVLQVPSPAASAQRMEAFRQGVRELGWIEGATVHNHFAFADGVPQSLLLRADEVIQ